MGIVGFSALAPTLAAIKTGKRVALANKEALVVAGHFFMEAVQASKATLCPVDSEHNAIWQCMPDTFVSGVCPPSVRKVILTASGGPFRTWTLPEMRAATPQQAISHPNWRMGPKISVDSATLVNKGLEWIEACWLFGLNESKLEILIHPQSLIHSMVEMSDSSILAQLGPSDMRVAIAYALGGEDRINSGVASLDWTQVASLSFETLDEQRFPAFKLVKEAFKTAPHMPCILNAANEVAVNAFLKGHIGFLDIYAIIEAMLSHDFGRTFISVADLLDLDQRVRTQSSLYAGLEQVY
jgi:1-deoxy-D-xylulose-5-phosphate reductoisomerase